MARGRRLTGAAMKESGEQQRAAARQKNGREETRLGFSGASEIDIEECERLLLFHNGDVRNVEVSGV